MYVGCAAVSGIDPVRDLSLQILYDVRHDGSNNTLAAVRCVGLLLKD